MSRSLIAPNCGSNELMICHCFGVCGETVLLTAHPHKEHCFSADSEAVA